MKQIDPQKLLGPKKDPKKWAEIQSQIAEIIQSYARVVGWLRDHKATLRPIF